jgi:hypothetical protein
MIDLVKKYAPTVGRLEEAPIITDDGQTIGWHSVFVADGGRALGGGCGRELEQARRVAVAEIIERGVFRELIREAPEDFLLDEFPTSCGFAAGFDDGRTKYRAVAEAVERWAFSQWIDFKYALDAATPSDEEFSALAAFFRGGFEEVRFFKKFFKVVCEDKILSLQLGICVGLKDGGAFPGARVCSLRESPWEHCLVEAWRHTLIAKEDIEKDSTNIQYRKRVIHFGANGQQALDFVRSADKKSVWPEPRLALLKRAPSAPAGAYVWRALCSDYMGWHLGGPDRFVY